MYLWTFCGAAPCRDSALITSTSITLSRLSAVYVAQPTSNHHNNWHQPYYNTPVELSLSNMVIHS